MTSDSINLKGDLLGNSGWPYVTVLGHRPEICELMAATPLFYKRIWYAADRKYF
jgi:hypothetical protein